MKPAKPDAPHQGEVPSPPDVVTKSTSAEQARTRRAIRKQVKSTYNKYCAKQAHSTSPTPADWQTWIAGRETARKLLEAYRVGPQEFADAVLELDPDTGVLYALVRLALLEHDEDSHAKGGAAKAAKYDEAKQALVTAFQAARKEAPGISIPKFVSQWLEGFDAHNQEPPLKEATAIRHLREVMKLKQK